MLKALVSSIRKRVAKALVSPLVINMIIVGGIGLLVKLVAFFKETMVASYFGLSLLLDTYYIAILIPSIVQNVFIGALNNLFIPNYVTEMKSSRNLGEFQKLTFLAITALVFCLIILVLVFDRFFLEMVFHGHDEAYYDLVRKQFYFALPCLFIWGYSGFLSGLLEIENKFLISSLSQFFTPVFTILFLLFLQPFFGDMTLVAGLTLGSAFSLFYLFIMARYQKVIRFSSLSINDNMREMLRQYPPKVTSGLLTGINPFVDQFFAAQLAIGSISAIQYGTKIPAFTVGILILAIGNVLLPHFSRLINDNINQAFKQLFQILKIVFLGSAVIIILTILFSSDIIRILFERDEFTSNDTIVVANIQRIALAYVPFYLCTLVCVRFLTAINKNRFMAWTSGWNLVLNLVLNIIFIKIYGVYGLVLSTTIVYIIASFIYVSFTYKQYKKRSFVQ
jgi:putative peptidoglycan lipid II flippase